MQSLGSRKSLCGLCISRIVQNALNLSQDSNPSWISINSRFLIALTNPMTFCCGYFALPICFEEKCAMSVKPRMGRREWSGAKWTIDPKRGLGRMTLRCCATKWAQWQVAKGQSQWQLMNFGLLFWLCYILEQTLACSSASVNNFSVVMTKFDWISFLATGSFTPWSALSSGNALYKKSLPLRHRYTFKKICRFSLPSPL